MKAQISVGATAVRLVTPGVNCRRVVIQNSDTTSAVVRLTIDGGATLPTASTGLRLIPGADLTISGQGAPNDIINGVWAVAESGTAVVDVETDDTGSI